jgi:hypothetical protein
VRINEELLDISDRRESAALTMRQPLYPQKLALHFVDKWRSLSRYSSLAFYRPLSLFEPQPIAKWMVNRRIVQGICKVLDVVQWRPLGMLMKAN